MVPPPPTFSTFFTLLWLPFNTAIVRGYNAVAGAKVKLGRWDEYLAMRRGILDANSKYRDLLSNDLGAIAGFLLDVGSGRYPAPPRELNGAALAQWEQEPISRTAS